MGIFKPDFAAVDAGFPMYEKSMYRVSSKAVTPEIWEKEEDGKKIQVSRIRVKLEMVGRYDADNDDALVSTDVTGEKSIKGKACQALDIYLHSPGALQMSKRALMALLGYRLEEENAFNAWFQQNFDAFTFAGDPGESEEVLRSKLGRGWNLLNNRDVNVFLQKVKEKRKDTNEEQDVQKMSAWTPVDGAEKIQIPDAA